MPQGIRARSFLLVVFAIGLVAGIQVWRTHPRADGPHETIPADTEVGQIIEGAGRANFDWFKQPGIKFGIAFKAEKTGEIKQISIPWRYTIKENNPTKSYGWGNYGVYTCELYANGKENTPAGEMLGSATDIMPTAGMKDARGRPKDDYLLPIPVKATVTAGEVYHLVIYNTDPDPATNWSSANTVMTRVTPWEEWIKSGVGARGEVCANGKWTPWSSKHDPWNKEQRNDLNGSHLAVIVTWANNSISGDPYWSSSVEEPAHFWGSYRAGELIYWNRPTVSIATIGLSVRKIGKPAGPLRYHLEDVEGNAMVIDNLANPNQVEQGAAQSWVYAKLTVPFTLTKGRQYLLWFDSPKSTDAQNCYLQAPVYGPGDADRNWLNTSWGGRKSHLILGSGKKWSHIDTHDLTFSIKTAP